MNLEQVLQMLLSESRFNIRGKKAVLIVLGEGEVDFATNMDAEALKDVGIVLAEAYEECAHPIKFALA